MSFVSLFLPFLLASQVYVHANGFARNREKAERYSKGIQDVGRPPIDDRNEVGLDLGETIPKLPLNDDLIIDATSVRVDMDRHETANGIQVPAGAKEEIPSGNPIRVHLRQASIDRMAATASAAAQWLSTEHPIDDRSPRTKRSSSDGTSRIGRSSARGLASFAFAAGLPMLAEFRLSTQDARYEFYRQIALADHHQHVWTRWELLDLGAVNDLLTIPSACALGYLILLARNVLIDHDIYSAPPRVQAVSLAITALLFTVVAELVFGLNISRPYGIDYMNMIVFGIGGVLSALMGFGFWWPRANERAKSLHAQEEGKMHESVPMFFLCALLGCVVTMIIHFVGAATGGALGPGPIGPLTAVGGNPLVESLLLDVLLAALLLVITKGWRSSLRRQSLLKDRTKE